MIRFMERNGYDVSYSHRRRRQPVRVAHPQPPDLHVHRARRVLSGGAADNVEAARDAGVNLAFFSGNEVYWKTRWEPSVDGNNTAYRTWSPTRRPGLPIQKDPWIRRGSRVWDRDVAYPRSARRSTAAGRRSA